MAFFGDASQGDGGGFFNPKQEYAEFRQDILDQRAAEKESKPMGAFVPTPPIIDNGGVNAVAPIDAEADIQSVGSSLLDSLETVGLNAANAAANSAAAIANGRMPFDPGNPNFGTIRPPQSSSTGGSLIPLLILIFIAVKVFG